VKWLGHNRTNFTNHAYWQNMSRQCVSPNENLSVMLPTSTKCQGHNHNGTPFHQTQQRFAYVKYWQQTWVWWKSLQWMQLCCPTHATGVKQEFLEHEMTFILAIGSYQKIWHAMHDTSQSIYIYICSFPDFV
jgi:hypothetical protein